MLWLRALVAWLVIIAAESIHGTLRELFLVPQVGDFRARQISVFVGSALILCVTSLLIRWLRADTSAELIGVGLLWLGLTVTFEFALGRLVLGLTWDRMLSEYDVMRGGLLGLGMMVLVISPWLAARWRVVRSPDHAQHRPAGEARWLVGDRSAKKVDQEDQ